MQPGEVDPHLELVPAVSEEPGLPFSGDATDGLPPAGESG
jgi:hypothetical protein